jgi:hypothetical protein
MPVLRPNEALLLLLVAVLAGRWCLLALLGRVRRPVLTTVDLGFGLLLLTGAVLPLLYTVARGRGLTLPDVLSAAVVIKYCLLFALFRLAVRTEEQALRCLWASLAAGVVVAVLAVLQSLGLFGVPGLLESLWAPAERGLYTGRGSSTIGNPHGAADLLVFNLAIALALGLRRPARPSSRTALALACVMLVGALGTGQASGVIGVLVGLCALAWVLRQWGRIAAGALLATPLAALVLLPVIGGRLASVEPATGRPASWSARLDNLSTYFWPQLFEGRGWLLGVQPVPEAAGIGEGPSTRHIESGHTWFLWIGGAPYLLAFLIFSVLVLRLTFSTARQTDGAFAVAGAAAFVAYTTVFVLTALDPHLFLRGSADLAVPLLGMAVVGLVRHRAPDDDDLPTISTASRGTT